MKSVSVTKDVEQNGLTENDSNEPTTKTTKFLLSDESFELLRAAQRRICDVTDVTPSLRKMINELVNPDSIAKLEERFINTLK